MPYHPRAYFPLACAHCGLVFEAKHLGRKYCSTPCNAQATRARKPHRLREVTAQLAAAQAELARVQAALATVPPAAAPPRASLPVPPPRPAYHFLPLPASEASRAAQTLVQQAQQYTGSVRVTDLSWEVGQVRVHEPDTDPYRVLQLHVAGKRLYWRMQLPRASDEWVRTDAF